MFELQFLHPKQWFGKYKLSFIYKYNVWLNNYMELYLNTPMMPRKSKQMITTSSKKFYNIYHLIYINLKRYMVVLGIQVFSIRRQILIFLLGLHQVDTNSIIEQPCTLKVQSLGPLNQNKSQHLCVEIYGFLHIPTQP